MRRNTVRHDFPDRCKTGDGCLLQADNAAKPKCMLLSKIVAKRSSDPEVYALCMTMPFSSTRTRIRSRITSTTAKPAHEDG